MRTAFAFFVLFHSLVSSTIGQPFRIATWQVPDLPTPRGVTNLPPAVATQIHDIAATLSSAEADAVILYGISDGRTLKQIGELMKPRKFSVVHQVVFRENKAGGSVVGAPFAILSPKQRMHAKTLEWEDTGRIDFPGGFAFATLRHGSSAVALYVAVLPGSLTNGARSADREYLGTKRDYAANYLAAHVGWLGGTYTNPVYAAYVTADISPAPKRALKDDCVALLEKAGFRTLLLGSPSDKSAQSVTNSQHLDRVLDPVFTKNVEFIASRQMAQPPPDHPLIICELTLKGAGVAAVPPVKRSSSSSGSGSRPSSPRPPAPEPAPVPVLEPQRIVTVPVPPAKEPAPAILTPTTVGAGSPAVPVTSATSAGAAPASVWVREARWLWPAIGGAASLFTLTVFLAFRAGRKRKGSLALSRRPGDAVFVEMKPDQSRTSAPDPAASEPAVVSEPTTSTDNSHNAIWQTPPVQVRVPNPPDPVRAGLMPHLRRLMREKLFLWLSHQRRQLIDSHETGTMQVLGLEERLEKIKDQFQDRLIAQEERIAELDRELQEKERILREKSRQENQR
jgi:hypothetical protein